MRFVMSSVLAAWDLLWKVCWLPEICDEKCADCLGFVMRSVLAAWDLFWEVCWLPGICSNEIPFDVNNKGYAIILRKLYKTDIDMSGLSCDMSGLSLIQVKHSLVQWKHISRKWFQHTCQMPALSELTGSECFHETLHCR